MLTDRGNVPHYQVERLLAWPLRLPRICDEAIARLLVARATRVPYPIDLPQPGIRP